MQPRKKPLSSILLVAHTVITQRIDYVICGFLILLALFPWYFLRGLFVEAWWYIALVWLMTSEMITMQFVSYARIDFTPDDIFLSDDTSSTCIEFSRDRCLLVS